MSNLGDQIQAAIDEFESIPDRGDWRSAQEETFLPALKEALNAAAPDGHDNTSHSTNFASESSLSSHAGDAAVHHDPTTKSDVGHDHSGESLSPGELSVSGHPTGKALDAESSPTIHQAFKMGVSGGDTTTDIYGYEPCRCRWWSYQRADDRFVASNVGRRDSNGPLRRDTDRRDGRWGEHSDRHRPAA